MSNPESLRVVDVLTASGEYLSSKGVESPAHAAKLLLSRLLNCKHLDLTFKFNDPLTDKQVAAMRRGIKRVGAGEPVQYVIGETDFMGHTVKTDRRALIPRPETEVLVDTVLHCEDLWRRPTPLVIDVGTGSGCIIISVAKARPDARYVAFDVSGEALALARENAATLDCADRITFTDGDMADVLEPAGVDAMISNLPYIPTGDLDALPANVRNHEPHTALDGGESGLEIITEKVYDATMALKPGGHIFLEIGIDQGPAVRALLEEAGFSGVSVAPDLTGRDRIAVGVLAG